jgi:transcriptional regulator with GAF, ATPase, and Fis domain
MASIACALEPAANTQCGSYIDFDACSTPSHRDKCGAGFEGIVGSSRVLRSVLDEVLTVASTDATVLIEGETGTGKELIANVIHAHSSRRGPLVKVNCAAIPLDLLESELFGHERGAFTGAVTQRLGRFEAANGGTLFLDEIADIPLALQPKLLRVLQEKEFERLGSGRTHKVDVRVVAATHRNLLQMVQRTEFRSDLYYRLNVFPIHLPPLRDRREDIMPLMRHFLEIYSRRMGRNIQHVPTETVSAFVSYLWPGNVRELQNMVERAVILSEDGILRNPLPTPEPQPARPARCVLGGSLEESERALILEALESVGWVVGGAKGAAAKLGCARTTLVYKMNSLGISKPVRA